MEVMGSHGRCALAKRVMVGSGAAGLRLASLRTCALHSIPRGFEAGQDRSERRMGIGLPISRRREDKLRLYLEQVVAELSSASGKHIDVAIDLPPEPLFVDAGRVGQLVSNLLGNALSHGAEDKPVELSAQVVEESVIISVSKGCVPIPPDLPTLLPWRRPRGTSRAGVGSWTAHRFRDRKSPRRNGYSLVVERENHFRGQDARQFASRRARSGIIRQVKCT